VPACRLAYRFAAPGVVVHVRRQSQACRARHRLRAPPGLLVAVDQHPGQPPRLLRGHVHGAVPHPRPRVLRLLRRSGRLAARAGRGRRLPGRRGDGRPAGTPAHPAGRPGGHGRVRRAARVHARSRGDRRRGLPRRRGLQRLPARGAGDDGGHRAARGPGPGLLPELLGDQPRFRRLLHGGRVRRRGQLSRRFPDRGGHDARLRGRGLPHAAGVASGRRFRRERGGGRRGAAGDGAARRAVHGRRHLVLPRRPGVPARDGRSAGRDGPGRVQPGRLRPGDRPQRGADRRPADPRHPAHRAPRPASAAARLLAARRVGARADRVRGVGRCHRAHGVRVDPRRDDQRADPDRARRPALPGARARPLPGGLLVVLGAGRPGRPGDVRRGHRPSGLRLAVGAVRGGRDGGRTRVRGPDAASASGGAGRGSRGGLGGAGPGHGDAVGGVAEGG